MLIQKSNGLDVNNVDIECYDRKTAITKKS